MRSNSATSPSRRNSERSPIASPIAPNPGGHPVELAGLDDVTIYDLRKFGAVQVYRALLESNAAFFAAQMTAMDTATRNSADMIASLTLYMNKVRQAAITREIIEVVSGAQAL